MSPLDWEGARRREKAGGNTTRASNRARLQKNAREQAMFAFAIKHDLSCFKCKRRGGPWAKTGTNNRGPWAICKGCVQAK